MDVGERFSSSITSLLPRTCNPRVTVGRANQDLGSAHNMACPVGSTPQQYMSMDHSSAFGRNWNSLDHSNICVDPLKGGFALGGYGLLTSTLSQFSCEPGFAERAARFSLLGNRPPQSFTHNDSQCSKSLSALTDETRSARIPARHETTSTVVTTAEVSVINHNGRNEVDGVDEQSSGDEGKKRPHRSCLPISSPAHRDEGCTTLGVEHVITPSPTESGTTNGSAGQATASLSSDCDRAASPRQHGKKRKVSSEGGKEASSATAGAQAKRSKGNDDKEGQKSKADRNYKANSGKQATGKDSKPVELPKTDYIHVRARRGQATDSHSLAERVRREKISERMKFLQDLVPGCSKVTGKAVMLDEIINYVQSIQRQVEFLSMKLAAVTPRPDFNIDSFLAKQLQMGESCGLPNMAESRLSYSQFSQLRSNQTLQTQPIFGNDMDNNFGVESALRRPHSTPVSQAPADSCRVNLLQTPSLWEDDLHSMVQMGYASNRIQPSGLGGTQCTLPSSHMKIEF